MRTDEVAADAGAVAPPPDRYGRSRQRRSRPWRRWLYLALALVVGGVVAYVAYLNLGSAPIDAERIGFVLKPDSAEITINVTRDDDNRAGVCIVRVRDKSGAESGRKELLVPAGAKYSRLSTVVKSIGPPVTADVYGCSYDIPRYLSSP
ncbi:DUF4307 domain-containing protein [Amycolatopsis sp. NPDC059021]|uniref:DUF4307 domain-containing protein n=1 Tax=Amycolatopsis sp. NPDC059021 TaxID=3346704 RepID=UPI00366B83B4